MNSPQRAQRSQSRLILCFLCVLCVLCGADLDPQLPPKSAFPPDMPRYPNLWFYIDARLAPSYAAAVKLVTDHLRRNMRIGRLWRGTGVTTSPFP